jgi:hypothetical protein
MKAIVMAVGLMSVLLLGNHEATAQMYQPYPYNAYWDGVQYQPYPYPQQYDPYYDLHVMHYQLYLQQYPGYPVYPSFYNRAALSREYPYSLRQSLGNHDPTRLRVRCRPGVASDNRRVCRRSKPEDSFRLVETAHCDPNPLDDPNNEPADKRSRMLNSHSRCSVQ